MTLWIEWKWYIYRCFFKLWYTMMHIEPFFSYLWCNLWDLDTLHDTLLTEPIRCRSMSVPEMLFLYEAKANYATSKLPFCLCQATNEFLDTFNDTYDTVQIQITIQNMFTYDTCLSLIQKWYMTLRYILFACVKWKFEFSSKKNTQKGKVKQFLCPKVEYLCLEMS